MADLVWKYLFLIDDESVGNQKLRRAIIRNMDESQMKKLSSVLQAVLQRRNFLPPAIQKALVRESKIVTALTNTQGNFKNKKSKLLQLGGKRRKLLRDLIDYVANHLDDPPYYLVNK